MEKEDGTYAEFSIFLRVKLAVRKERSLVVLTAILSLAKRH